MLWIIAFVILLGVCIVLGSAWWVIPILIAATLIEIGRRNRSVNINITIDKGGPTP